MGAVKNHAMGEAERLNALVDELPFRVIASYMLAFFDVQQPCDTAEAMLSRALETTGKSTGDIHRLMQRFANLEDKEAMAVRSVLQDFLMCSSLQATRFELHCLGVLSSTTIDLLLGSSPEILQ